MDISLLIQNLLESAATRDRGVFLFQLQRFIKELEVLSPTDAGYSNPIEISVFLDSFQKFVTIVGTAIKTVEFMKNRLQDRGVDKLGGANINMTYNLDPLIGALKNLFLKVSMDYDHLFSKDTLNEKVVIDLAHLKAGDLDSFKQDAFAYIYKTLAGLVISITIYPLHGGDFVIRYNFEQIKSELIKLGDDLARDLTVVGTALLGSGQMTKEEFMKNINDLKDARLREL